MGKRPDRENSGPDEWEKVPLIPGPGARLKNDGTWLEPQPDGGYLLRQPRGTHGAPAALRRRMRGALSERMHVAIAILADEGEKNEKGKWIRHPPKHRDKLAALEFLARYGLGQRKEVLDAELVKALALAVQAEVREKEVLRRIEARWANVLKEHIAGTQDEH